MNTMREYLLPALTIIGGGGVVYYLLSLRDTTPVGLTVNKIENSDGIRPNENEAFRYDIVSGTYRESENTLPLKSDDNNLIIVVYKEGEIVYADLLNKTDSLLTQAYDSSGKTEEEVKEHYLKATKEMKTLIKNVTTDTTLLDDEISRYEQNDTQSAEMILRPTNTLQSHFVW